MTPDERATKRRLLVALLSKISLDEFKNAGMVAMGMPPGMLMALGIVPGPRERLATYRDPKALAEHMQKLEASEEDDKHQHGPECTGECGSLWFFGEIADMVMGLCEPDAAKVERLLLGDGA